VPGLSDEGEYLYVPHKSSNCLLDWTTFRPGRGEPDQDELTNLLERLFAKRTPTELGSMATIAAGIFACVNSGILTEFETEPTFVGESDGGECDVIVIIRRFKFKLCLMYGDSWITWTW
jgi:hypothetical protein